MDANVLDVIDVRRLGRELQQAREKSGIKQSDAAKHIGVARTTLSAIEHGERRIQPAELIKLARLYSCQVNELLRERPEIQPFRVQFRGPSSVLTEMSREVKAKVDQSRDELEELCRNYLELERITESPMPRNYPREYRLNGTNVDRVAESIAVQERNRLGLGDGPILALRDILEQDVGLRIFYIPLDPSSFSEMYYYDEQVGGCMAINRKHPEERRRWSLAHGYAHFLVHRYSPAAFIDYEEYQRVPEHERFADTFALHFLMPTSGVTRRFNDMSQETGKFSPADLCMLAHFYGVSVAACTRRLEEMGLLPTGTWEHLKRRGFRVRAAQQELGLDAFPARNDMLPIRYQYLAVDAYDRSLLTEGQLARFLGVSHVEARRVVKKLRRHSRDVTDETLVDIDLTQSLST